MNNTVEKLIAKVEGGKTMAKRILLRGGLATTILLSPASPKNTSNQIEKSDKEPIAQTETLPKNFILVDKINTSCGKILELECSIECGYLKEVEYCPLDQERYNLFIDPALEEGDTAFLINHVKNDFVESTWVVENPNEVVDNFDSNLPIYYKTVYIDWDNQGVE